MTEAAVTRTAPTLKAALVAAMLAMAGCSGMMNTPTAQSVASLSPAGNVTITEDFVTGVGGGAAAAPWSTRGGPIHSRSSALLLVPVAGLRKSALPAPSTSSRVSPTLGADTRKAPAKPVSAHRAATICGWRTAPA